MLSGLAEGRSWARLGSVVELWWGREEGRWEEGAGALLVLMLREGDSGFGVEDADGAGRERGWDFIDPIRTHMMKTCSEQGDKTPQSNDDSIKILANI